MGDSKPLRMGKVLVCGSRDWPYPAKIKEQLRKLPRGATVIHGGPDLVLAFQKDGSTGTQHTIDEARRRGIPVEVFTCCATGEGE